MCLRTLSGSTGTDFNLISHYSTINPELIVCIPNSVWSECGLQREWKQQMFSHRDQGSWRRSVAQQTGQAAKSRSWNLRASPEGGCGAEGSSLLPSFAESPKCSWSFYFYLSPLCFPCAVWSGNKCYHFLSVEQQKSTQVSWKCMEVILPLAYWIYKKTVPLCLSLTKLKVSSSASASLLLLRSTGTSCIRESILAAAFLLASFLDVPLPG